MGFMNALGRTVGELRSGLRMPYHEDLMELELKKLRQAAEEAADLVMKQSQAENPQIPLRKQTWNKADEIARIQAFERAGIDPNALSSGRKTRAEADIAEQQAKAFTQGLSQITSPYALAALGLGKDVKPIAESGGAFFRQYDPDNFMTGQVTPESQAKIGKYKAETETERFETGQAQIELADKFMRLGIAKDFFDTAKDPLLRMDAAQDKSVSDAKEVEYTGKDGKSHKGMMTRTPSGNYVVTDVTKSGEPITVPSSSEEDSLARRAKLLVRTGRAKNEKEAMTLLTSKLTETPEQAWSTIVRGNVKNPLTGKRYSADEIMQNAMQQWAMERPGQPLPSNITETINNMDVGDKQKNALQSQVTKYDALVKQLTSATTPTVPTLPATVIPEVATANAPPPLPEPALMPQATPPPPAPAPEPAITLRKPTPDVMNSALAAIDSGSNPLEVRNALIQSGYDMTPHSVIQDAILAINMGVPREAITQRLTKLGYDPAALAQQGGA